MSHAMLTHGEPARVADMLDDEGFGDEPSELRAALINALRRIAELERQLDRLLKVPDPMSQILNEGDGVYRP